VAEGLAAVELATFMKLAVKFGFEGKKILLLQTVDFEGFMCNMLLHNTVMTWFFF
jgi:hypothetical protein